MPWASGANPVGPSNSMSTCEAGVTSPKRIAVAMCICNGAAYLAEQLESLLAQSLAPAEVIVVDDASEDDTVGILRSYQTRLTTLTVVCNLSRLGVSANFAKAFSLCSAEFIAPCDQDDIWAPEKLAALAEAIDDHDLAYCDSRLIDSTGRTLGRRVSQCYTMYSGKDPRVFTLANCVSGHASLFRRSLLDRMPLVPANAYYDWWLAVNAAAMGGVVYLDRPLVQFRQHEQCASAFTGRRPEQKRINATERWRNELSNLAALGTVPAGDATQDYFRRVAELWRRHPQRRLDWPLFLFAWRHRRILFALRRTQPWLRWRHAFKTLIVPKELRSGVGRGGE